MKRYKEIVKKLGAVTLALAMAATMLPGTANAEEAEAANGSQPVQETQTEESLPPAEQATDAEETGETREEVKTEGNGTPEEQVVPEEDTASVQSDNTQENDLTNAANGSAVNEDVNRPVIEKVEFPQNGQTLHAGDTIEIRVDAYDADSGISRIDVLLQESAGNGYGIEYEWIYPEYDEAQDCYIGTYTLGSVGDGTVIIDQIRVVDYNSNYTDAEVRDENYDPVYSFKVEDDGAAAVISDFVLNVEGGVLTAPHSLDVSFALTENVGIDSARLRFVSDADEYSYFEASMYYSEESGRYMEGSLSYGGTQGTYTLERIELERFGSDLIAEIENPEQYSFEYQISQEVQDDTEAPRITSISVDKNGEIVEAGDVVNVTIEAEDNVGLSQYGGVAFSGAAQNVEDDYQYVSLEYNEELGAFTGSFEITDTTYPCEWYIERIDIWDAAGNGADYYSLINHAQYYVLVYSGDVFSNPVYTVSFNMMELSEDGYWTAYDTVETQVERRTTFSEAGIELPQLESKYDGFNFTGWVDIDGNPITEDTVIVDNSYYTLYAEYDKTLVELWYNYFNTDGLWDNTMTEVVTLPADASYSDLNSVIAEKEAPESYSGLVFTGWKGQWEDDGEIPLSRTSARVIASYETIPVLANYYYLDNAGNIASETDVISMAKGSTYGDLYEQAETYMPDDISTEYGTPSWELEEYAMAPDEALEEGDYTAINMYSKYEGKDIISVGMRYYDEEGRGMTNRQYDAVVIDEDTSPEELKEILDGWDVPAMYEGLRFSGWEYSFMLYEDEELGNFDSESMTAVYENCAVRYVIDSEFADGMVGMMDDSLWDHIIIDVVEKGETITIPHSFEGIGDVIYLNAPESDTVTVNGNLQYFAYPTSEAADPENPTTPENPSTPETPVTPGTPGQPSGTPGAGELTDSEIANVVDRIQGTSAGSSVAVDMGGATVVPVEVLRAAQGKDVDIVLDMGGYTWTINGTDISADNLKDINLEVTLNSNAIPSSTVQKLANGRPVKQISLTHEGDFGFRASLTFNMGSQFTGEFGNLYYYDSDGRMVYMSSDEVNANGDVTFSFSHASDYVVVVSEQPMSQTDVPADLQPLAAGGQASGDAVKTGDASSALPIIVVMILAAGAAVGAVAVRRRRK